MYRVIIILLTINLVSCYWRKPNCFGRPCDPRLYGHFRRHNNYHKSYVQTHTSDKSFENLANIMINIDKTVQASCKASSIDITEVYSATEYVLRYTMERSWQSNVSVRIQHPVIYLALGKGEALVEDVRVLPHIVNGTAAKWNIGSDGLEISIPYIVRDPDAANSCKYKTEINIDRLID